MTYRDDDLAEEERERALERDLLAIDATLSEAGSLERRRRALGRALRDAEDAVGKKRAKVPLPLLARVEIASPCHARWDEMSGDARVRHCASCDENVYDLSEMTAADAEALLSRDGPLACVRLHRRADGTVITADCSVGASKKRQRRWLAAGAAVAGSLMAAAAGLAVQTTQGEPRAISLEAGAATTKSDARVVPPNVVTPAPRLASDLPRVAMGLTAIRHDPPVDARLTPVEASRPRADRARTRRAAASR